MRVKRMIFKRIAPVFMVAILTMTGVPASGLRGLTDYDASAMSSVWAASPAQTYGLTDDVEDGAILHAWCWSFHTIKENMRDIAAAGYTAVQTSPANNVNESNKGMHLDGDGNWWWQYQPTDWKIGNYQMGTRDDFIALCNEAHKYGVKVIVDVVPNHTTPDLSRVSQDLLNAAGGQENLYHANGFNEISNYSDRYECTTGQMGGLPDVNTENKGFQKYFLQYINDLIACGCDGFRYDTAKHIGAPSDPLDAKSTENDFWKVVTGEQSVDGVSLANKDELFIYGEILQDYGIPYHEYAQYMRMTASSYGNVLRNQVRNNNFSVDAIMDWNHSEQDRLVTWVESHDTYCNEHESAWMTDEQIRLAWALIAAREKGTPLFYSRPDGSNGSAGNYWGNNVLGAKGNDQFKAPEVVAVNFFRNAMIGENEMLRNPNGNSKILQIDRGSKGTCIVNLDGPTTLTNVETSLADGSYTDQVSGRMFTVSDGKLSGQLDGRKVAVIYHPDREELAVTSVTGSNTFQNTLQVRLVANNLTDATYTTSEHVAGVFQSGDTITIGANSQYGDTITVTVSAIGQNGTVTASETFKKQKSVIDGSYDIYFKKPSGWGNAIHCYAYQSDGTQNATWPGVQMDALGEDIFGYLLPEDWDNAKVIFNDGSNQDPARNEPGFDYVDGTIMLYSDGAFTEVKDLPEETEAPKTEEPKTEETEEPKTGEAEEPKTGEAEEPKTGETEEPKTGEAEEPKTGEAEEPKTGDVEEPRTGEAEEPKNDESEESKTGEAEESKIGEAEESKSEESKSDGESESAEKVTLGYDNVSLASERIVYNGQAQEPFVTVNVNGTTLTAGIDYEVTYRNNINACGEEMENPPTVTVSGKGSYTGMVEKTFTIDRANSPEGAPENFIRAGKDDNKVGDIRLNPNWLWNASDAEKELKPGDTLIAIADYTGNDIENYVVKSVLVLITKAESDISSEDSKNGNEAGSVEENGNEAGSVEENGNEAGSEEDNENGNEAGSVEDNENGNEAGSVEDSENGNKAGSVEDNENGNEAGSVEDNGNEAGSEKDSENGNEAGSVEDNENGNEAGFEKDSENGNEAGSVEDNENGNEAGSEKDSENGNEAGSVEDKGDGNVTDSGVVENQENGTEIDNGNETGYRSETDTKIEIGSDDTVVGGQIGDIISDSATNAKYRITGDSTVEFVELVEKRATVVIQNTITVNGKIYTVTSIADYAFKNDKTLKKVTFGKHIEKIGKNAFRGCTNLKTVKLNTGLKTIDKNAFYKDTKLTGIVIPASVKKIGANAFYGDKNLKKITVKTKNLTKSNVGSKAFKGIYKKAKIKVPGKKLNSYKKIFKEKGIPAKARIYK